MKYKGAFFFYLFCFLDMAKRRSGSNFDGKDTSHIFENTFYVNDIWHPSLYPQGIHNLAKEQKPERECEHKSLMVHQGLNVRL